MLKFSFRQQLIAGFLVSVLLVFVVGMLSYLSISKLESNTVLVDHTQQTIKTADKILGLVIDAETGMRGYAATGERSFLTPYNQAIPEIKKTLSDLSALVSDNPIQIAQVDSLTRLTDLEISILTDNIKTRETNGLDYLVAHRMLLDGKQTMDSIRSLTQHIIDQENLSLSVHKKSSENAAQLTIITLIVGSIVFFLIILTLFFYIQKTFNRQKTIEEVLSKSKNQLETVLKDNERKNWVLVGTGKMSELVQGEQSTADLSAKIIKEACLYCRAIAGTFYLYNEGQSMLEFKAGFAFQNLDGVKKQIRVTDGWIGHAVSDREVMHIQGRLNENISLESSLLKNDIVHAFTVPFFFDKSLKGVFEIGFQHRQEAQAEEYLLSIASIVGVAVNTAQARAVMHELFEETQQQAEELEAQQEEMRVTNEELMKKTEMLQASEEELMVQQEELRSSNAELEEKASLLEGKNHIIEVARKSISEKMRELENTSKYKSEFLANMSHELRTPLNSILVLARILRDNKPDNLTTDQIKYASVIFNAGNDLLTLINDILDLSKIESGKLEIITENVRVTEILRDLESLFTEVAKNKQIKFTTNIDSNVPDFIVTDKLRTEQVLKNLLSNAFKFTSENGSVAIEAKAENKGRNLALTIRDTGVGIPHDKQKVIFEAFQQADGSTSRKYGGTGLGLSISRELANLMGGTIRLKSVQGEGSEFTLVLPLDGKITKLKLEDEPAAANPNLPEPLILNNEKAIDLPKKADGEAMVVIVEDDVNFAAILQNYAKEHGYKSVLVHEGDKAVDVIKAHQPNAVILDIMLPGKDGWQILKELKNDKQTAEIPVHIMSAGDATANRIRKSGAISFLKKPINTELLDKLFKEMAVKNGSLKRVLLIEDHQVQSFALKELLEKQDIAVDQAFDGESALTMLNGNEYQCIILDINLPDISGLDLLDKIKEIERFATLPVIVNTAMELDKASVNRLMQYANAMVIKNNKSSERLIDEVNLFLNKVNSGAATTANPETNSKSTSAYTGDKNMLRNKKILIVDDDMRNIFALSSALQTYDMQVEIANDGAESLIKLEEIPDIDMVLMDIMMPKMDGHEAMREIRKKVKWAKLPVIALTAKAMKEDREKCIEAGASDYITKPVDMDKLLALMQVWLGKK